MESIIQKAAKGDRAAMTELYENNATAVYCLANALVRGSEQAISATRWGIQFAFLAVEKGTVQSEEEFALLAMKQAADFCKKEVVQRDSRAFKLPPQKDFYISRVNEQFIDPNGTDAENCIRCLPAIQRFTFVLRHLGNLDDLQIGNVIGMDAETVSLIREAEGQNLAKICKAVNAAGGSHGGLVPEAVSAGFAKLLDSTQLPDAVGEYIENYIELFSRPVESAFNNKGKKIGILAAAVLACIAILVATITGGSNSTVFTSDNDDFYETSGIEDTTDGTEEAGSGDADISDSALDPALTYYAKIEVEGYGTITVQLDQNTAPVTAENFVKLAESGFYDGLTFHRIYEGFMIQGGDPNGDGTGGSDEEIVGEFASNGFENNLSHTRGVISMARASDYNSASSQFFIVHEDSDFLDGEYAAFGWITEGMEVVDAICEDAEPYDDNGMMYAEDQPVITSITIGTVSNEATDSTDSTDTTEATDSDTVTE